MDETISLQAIYKISGDTEVTFEIKDNKRHRAMLNAIKLIGVNRTYIYITTIS